MAWPRKPRSKNLKKSSTISYLELVDAVYDMKRLMSNANRHGITADEVYETFVEPQDIPVCKRAAELGLTRYSWNTEIEVTTSYLHEATGAAARVSKMEVNLGHRCPVPEYAGQRTVGDSSLFWTKALPWLQREVEIRKAFARCEELLRIFKRNDHFDTVMQLRHYLPCIMPLFESTGRGVSQISEFSPSRVRYRDIPLHLIKACASMNTTIAGALLIDSNVTEEYPHMVITGSFHDELLDTNLEL